MDVADTTTATTVLTPATANTAVGSREPAPPSIFVAVQDDEPSAVTVAVIGAALFVPTK